MNSGETILENDTLIDVTVSRPYPLVVVLTFAPLRTSHGDEYRCVAGVDVAAGVSLTNSSVLNFTVQSTHVSTACSTSIT